MPFFQKEAETEKQSGRTIETNNQVDETSPAEPEAGKHHDLGRQEERPVHSGFREYRLQVYSGQRRYFDYVT